MQVTFLDAKVRDYLLTLEKPSRAKSFKYIKLLQSFGNSIGMPYSKKLLSNLYELRVRGQQEIRIFYCFHKGQAIIVHAFIKKTQKTPQREMQIALERISLLT